jgi:hypothetical protein
VAKSLGENRCKIFTFEGFDEKYDIIDYFRDGGDLAYLKELIERKSRYAFEL